MQPQEQSNVASKAFSVTVSWDDEAKVWYVAESDVPGLATEAESMDRMLEKLKVMVPEMLELNGVIAGGQTGVPFRLLTHVSGAPDHG